MLTHIKKDPCNFILYILAAKEIYCIVKTCCIISLLSSKKCHLFHYFIFSVQMIPTLYIHHALMFNIDPVIQKLNVVHWYWQNKKNKIQ